MLPDIEHFGARACVGVQRTCECSAFSFFWIIIAHETRARICKAERWDNEMTRHH